MDSENLTTPAARPRRDAGTHYKFQRLREQIRSAILAGEFSGKLPGERALAGRFRVNAKTLSKALTDLAAEGLLERRIGRGTYVAGQVPALPQHKRWIILVDGDCASNPLVTELLKLNPESRPATAAEILRLSLVSPNAIVVNCCRATDENLYRNLALRGVPLIETSRLPQRYSAHGALLDRHLAAFNLGRDLLLGGHSRLAALDLSGSTALFAGLWQAARRYGNGVIETLAPEQIRDAFDDGTTAFVCDGVDLASETLCRLNAFGVRPGQPSHVSLCAVGALGQGICCTGYYIDPVRHAAAVADVAGSLHPNRVSLLWLTGTYVERGTLAMRLERRPEQPSAQSLAMIV